MNQEIIRAIRKKKRLWKKVKGKTVKAEYVEADRTA
jgi:hypothetical protein